MIRLELGTIQFTCYFDPSHHLEKTMSRSNMLIVAEGILDSAAAEYRETNLASCESVADYASNGCGIELTEDECERVLCACRKYIAAESSSSNDYYAIVEEALNT